MAIRWNRRALSAWHLRLHGYRSVDIDIQMPREGRVDLHTSDGKIDLANFKGEMQLRSGDGSQEIDNVDGKLRATTGDGHIRANGRFDELESRPAMAALKRGPQPARLVYQLAARKRRWHVTLEVPENLAADLDLHTGDGHIDLDMPVTTSARFARTKFAAR